MDDQKQEELLFPPTAAQLRTDSYVNWTTCWVQQPGGGLPSPVTAGVRQYFDPAAWCPGSGEHLADGGAIEAGSPQLHTSKMLKSAANHW